MNGKLNGLIIEWLEVNKLKNEHAKKKEYEKASIARDKERSLEIRIVDECNLKTSTTIYTGEVRSYVIQYLADKHGINYDELDMSNIKSTIRQIKLDQLDIK
jgi:DNA polymerase/3'-5' exonuclease PolX